MASKLGLLMVLWGVAQLESAVIPKETCKSYLVKKSSFFQKVDRFC